MKTLRFFLLAFPLLCGGATALSAVLADPLAGPPAEIIQTQQKIDQLDKLEPTPANKQLKEVYQQVLALQQETAGYLEKARSLSQQLKEHAERGREMRLAMEEASAALPAPTFAGKSLQELERMQEVAATEKIALQNRLDEAQNRLAQLQARLVPAQNELAEAKKSLEQAGKEGKLSASPQDLGLANALLLKRKAVNEARIAQIQALDLELLSIPNQTELAGLQKSLLVQKLKNLGQQLERLQGRLRELRQEESVSILDESLQLRKTANEDPALRWLAEENVAFGNQLAAYAEDSQVIADRSSAIGRQTGLIEQRHSMLRQQLDLGGEVGGIGELMRQTLMQLESSGAENTSKTIEEIRKAQIQSLVYERQTNELADKEAFLQSLVGRFPDSQMSVVNSEMRERLASLLELRGNLLAKLLDRNQQSLKNWSLLLNAQNQFNDAIRRFDKLLKENLLWTETNPAMGGAWLADFALGWRRLDLRGLWDEGADLLRSRGWTLAALALAYAGLRYFLRFSVRPGFEAWQKAANASVSNVRRDKFRNTWYMLAGEFALALPVPLLLAGLKILLGGLGEEEAWTRLLGEGLRIAAGASLILGFLRRLAKPGGFLEGQLAWPGALAAALHRGLRLRGLLVLLVAVVFVSETQSNSFLRYEFGRLPFLALCLLLALLLRKLAKAVRPPEGAGAPFWNVSESPDWFLNFCALAEIGLAVMEVSGFHLGAIVLQGRLFKTLGWVVAIAMAHQIFQRWLLLEQRRMAYAHAMAVREERRAAGGEEGGGEAATEGARREFAEIQTLSLQSKTLLTLLSVVAFAAALGWVWADMIPAFYLLDQVVLWEVATPGSAGGIEAVTLKSLLLALAVAGLAALAARSLPAMLQLLVLQHLSLAPGSDFAATTLLKYGIFVAGIVAVCKLLGLQWGQLQWLVAALSFGLGFGLQEIFANFISGLIILFERPVRIGDIVTLSNGVTGTIDAINTRATTLTDWDNKEIIIPNKTLITEQLTNWSLSSLVIRVVVPVGIAYGSDTELAHRLLMRVAEEHPAVLDKPEKAVFFRAFGASSLDFELRVFISNPASRVSVVHDLNMRIDRLFREHGVEIAFPQMDVHIKDDVSATRPARRGPDPSRPE
jgi:potassium efflux system protein